MRQLAVGIRRSLKSWGDGRANSPLVACKGGCMDRSHSRFSKTHPQQFTVIDPNQYRFRPLGMSQCYEQTRG